MADDYREVLGSVEGLRRGFTTGTAAQAASRAAALALLDGEPPATVTVTLRDSRTLTIPVANTSAGEGWAACGIVKDAGDDEDVTHGAEIRATVKLSKNSGIRVLGGVGVGTVTKPGLPVAVGEAAINPNPMRRIIAELEPLLSRCPDPGLEVTISVPDGEALARRTWNPRLGIEGGISIIGTTGVVEPKSNRAYRASIVLALKVLKASGCDVAALAFGYVGENWYRDKRGWGEDRVVKTGDHIGFALSAAAARGFGKVVVVGHVGKMAKVAAGLFDTHWSVGDARLETIAAWAGAAGADRDTIREILELKTAEAAVALLEDRELNEAWTMMNRRLLERCRLKYEKEGKPVPAMESVLLNLEGKELSRDEI